MNLFQPIAGTGDLTPSPSAPLGKRVHLRLDLEVEPDTPTLNLNLNLRSKRNDDGFYRQTGVPVNPLAFTNGLPSAFPNSNNSNSGSLPGS